MSFSDVFKKSFLEGYVSIDISPKMIAVTMLITAVFAVYLFFVYRIFVRKTFYNKNFNISISLIAMITAAIIMTIQSSIVVSLGMVGALSIVRFRTAIKDPMDLVFSLLVYRSGNHLWSWSVRYHHRSVGCGNPDADRS